MVDVELMDAKGVEIEDVGTTFPLVTILRLGLGPSYTDQLEWLDLYF